MLVMLMLAPLSTSWPVEGVVDMWCVVASLNTPQTRSWLVVCLIDGNQWVCCMAVSCAVAYCVNKEVTILVQVGCWVWRLAKRDPGEADLVMLLQYCDMGGMTTDVWTLGGVGCWGRTGGGCGGGVAEACATRGGGTTLVGPRHRQLEVVSLAWPSGWSRSHAFQSSWLSMSTTVKLLSLAYAQRIWQGVHESVCHHST